MKLKLLFLIFASVIVSSCATSLPTSFSTKTLSENKTAGNIESERHILIRNTTNFRDIGGIFTTKGKTVKWGFLFRSDNLSELKDKDFDSFNSLSIKTVIDLRTNSEATSKEDNLPENVSLLAMPIVSDQGDLLAQMKQKVLRGEIEEATSKELMKEFYIKCITDSVPMLREIVQKIAFSKDPILYHCSAGKDRTGVVTALLLSILKVDRKTIMNEYLLSNYYRKDKIQSTLKKAKILKLIRPNLNTTVILNFMSVDSDYLNAVFDVIDTEYNGVDSFIKNQLGIDNQTRNDIINRLTY